MDDGVEHRPATELTAHRIIKKYVPFKENSKPLRSGGTER